MYQACNTVRISDPEDEVTLHYLANMIRRVNKGENLTTFDHVLVNLMTDMHKFYQGDLSLEEMRESAEASISMLDEFGI